MKNYLIAISLCLTLFAISSCNKENGSIELVFEVIANNERLDYSNIYTSPSGDEYQVCDLRVYLSDLTITGEDGETILSDIELLNFGNCQDPTDPLSNPSRILVEDLESGDFSAINFGIGVSPDLNGTDPATFENDHPLSINNGMYWSWAAMYRFFVIDGQFDNTGDSQPNEGLAFHIGTDGLYKTKSLSHSFEINKEENTVVTISIDLDKAFNSGGDLIDFSTDFDTHTMDNMPLAVRMSETFPQAFSIKN